MIHAMTSRTRSYPAHAFTNAFFSPSKTRPMRPCGLLVYSFGDWSTCVMVII